MRHKKLFDRVEAGVKYLEFTSRIKATFRDELAEVVHFPIVFDPSQKKKALIMGMFVLRPTRFAWVSPIVTHEGNINSQLHEVEEWSYNYKGIDGGWLIADCNPFDAFRLALQYGISDAVIVGTNTVSKEGIDGPLEKGYLWQPYYITGLKQLSKSCPDALQLIDEQRVELQQQGHISSRKYPAQIIFSHSGDCQGSYDFLEARIFRAIHPNGDQFECYILTSDKGAVSIQKRVVSSFPHLVDRIASMIIIVPNSPTDTDMIDISVVPKLLYDRLGIRIANHDGGQGVLRDFCRAGAIAQVNLTLCRKHSLIDVIPKYLHLLDKVLPTGVGIPKVSNAFDGSNVQLFFSSPAAHAKCQISGELSGTIPASWKEIYCVTDSDEEVAVITFDTRTAVDFCAD